jgi:hypothetical protein
MYGPTISVGGERKNIPYAYGPTGQYDCQVLTAEEQIGRAHV